MNYIQAIKNRRSVYAISNEEIVSPADIETFIATIVEHAPSPFHLQSDRVVVLFHEHHKKLWDIVKTTLKSIVPPEQFLKTEQKVNGFSAGYGTVLFFQEQNDITALENKYPPYKENFKPWALSSNAMLQFAIWTGLENLGLGANLQHYNPLIDQEVKTHFQLPMSWTLTAQMPFGNIVKPAQEKTSKPLSQLLIVKK